jgi:NADP-dependent 3-hydroxy acid dehydrogenase YdfG
MPSTANPEVAQRQPELLGQTVVVIGGSAGIGLETARRARAEGADVVLTGRNPDRLDQAASDVGAHHTQPSMPTTQRPWRFSFKTSRHRSTT